MNASSEGFGSGDQIVSYAPQMTVVSGETEVPEGWIAVEPSQEDFYDTLIDAYATAIVERMDE